MIKQILYRTIKLLPLLLIFTVFSCTMGGPGSGGNVPEEAREFARQVNDYRKSIGLEPLVWHQDLFEIAQSHSEDMAANDYFSHTNLDGQSPFDRLEEAGITYSTAGENIAYGYATAEEVLTGWLDSAGHKENIERAAYTHHGAGYDPDGHYWTHLFAGNPETE
jgi:uncharacterized protein YkwD